MAYPMLSGFIRSDLLSSIPYEAQEMLYAYGVRTVVDLRTTEETLRWPCPLADDARFSYNHCNLEGDEPVPGYDLSQENQPLAYSYALFLAARRSAIRAVFATLADGYRFLCLGFTEHLHSA